MLLLDARHGFKKADIEFLEQLYDSKGPSPLGAYKMSMSAFRHSCVAGLLLGSYVDLTERLCYETKSSDCDNMTRVPVFTRNNCEVHAAPCQHLPFSTFPTIAPV